jgi:hypothetical protein
MWIGKPMCRLTQQNTRKALKELPVGCILSEHRKGLNMHEHSTVFADRAGREFAAAKSDVKKGENKMARFICNVMCSLLVAALMAGCGGGGGSGGGGSNNSNGGGGGTVSTYAVSGSVLSSSGTALPGATVTLTGSSASIATTDANGAYTFTGAANGIYTLSVSLSGYTFSPTSIQVVVNNGNMAGQNFAGTGNPQAFSISGTVTSGSSGLSGATVMLTGASTFTTTTNVNGAYTITGSANGTYTLSVSLSGYTFSPTSIQVASGSYLVGQNFVGTANPHSTYPTITGTVTSGGSALPGATVELVGTLITTTTNASGTYTLTGNLASGTYTLSVYLNGYSFSPPSSTVVLNSGGLLMENFVGTASSQTYSISGTVANSGHIAISGATVKLSGSGSSITTTTNSYGAYTFSGVYSGAYTLSVNASGSTDFNIQQVTVTGNMTGVNFVESL